MFIAVLIYVSGTFVGSHPVSGYLTRFDIVGGCGIGWVVLPLDLVLKICSVYLVTIGWNREVAFFLRSGAGFWLSMLHTGVCH